MMIDIHMHIIPEVDDGAIDLMMAEEMLVMAVNQGITSIIATSHSDSFEFETEKVRRNYRRLKKLIFEKEIPINIYLGSEVYCEPPFIDSILANLQSGIIPSMNDTKYVLTEFYDPTEEDAMLCINRLVEHGWVPVIAHAERYNNLSINTYKRIKETGCYIQVNAYSIYQEKKEPIKRKANDLLSERLVDFLGSDAHRIGHRPPAVEKGIEYLYDNYEREYAEQILFENAEKLLLNF